MSAPLSRQDRTRGRAPLVDALARAAADGTVTRRGALRGLLAGLAGAALDPMRPRPAAAATRRADPGGTVAADSVIGGAVSAAATGNGPNFDATTQCCNGADFDATTKSCGGSGATTRTSSYTPSYNGCGGAGGIHLPERYDFANFTPACNAHDQCWGTCGADKGQCDRSLLNNLFVACGSAYPWTRQPLTRFACNGLAISAFDGVSYFGENYYRNGQTEGCTCCVAGTACVNTACCGNTCLSVGQACCGSVAYDPSTEQCCNGAPLPRGTPCCPAGTTPCGQNNCCLSGHTCVNGRCVTPPGRIYCSCNDSCYSSVPDCIGHCNANLGCFTGICIPAPAGKCGA